VQKPAPLKRGDKIAVVATAGAVQDEQLRAGVEVLERAGFAVDGGDAGLYLWATRGEPCRRTVDSLAELGMLVAPGEFYGAAGGEHVRVALTATDERVAAAVARLKEATP